MAVANRRQRAKYQDITNRTAQVKALCKPQEEKPREISEEEHEKRVKMLREMGLLKE